ncbi:hypothetical protein [Acinetobacter calcoaceticus]|uniref:hypothetical protein n=1 Tax=Acinetobacter calcoaceticus TaxID=471 RepID=UPI00285719D7|nr:hypothetical protein [Acinetobacter calcoaceticus]MDR6798321.1 hypothetical protein [Acinetobacter calcoaceticus]
MSIVNIKKDVLEFLHGFSKIDKDDFHLEVLSLFPKACCEYSSLLLARFLIEVKCYTPTDIFMIKGQSLVKADQLHSWLKVNGIIIDITAGQFEAEKPIIIDAHSSWHNNFFYELETYVPSTDFKNYVDDFGELTLEKDYLMIVQRAHQNSTLL